MKKLKYFSITALCSLYCLLLSGCSFQKKRDHLGIFPIPIFFFFFMQFLMKI